MLFLLYQALHVVYIYMYTCNEMIQSRTYIDTLWPSARSCVSMTHHRMEACVRRLLHEE